MINASVGGGAKAMKRIHLFYRVLLVIWLWAGTVQFGFADSIEVAKEDFGQKPSRLEEISTSLPPTEYYREWVITFAEGKKTIHGRLWVMKNMWREEIKGSNIVTIGKRDQQSSKLWKLRSNKYCELEADIFDIKEEKLESEPIGNIAASKVRVFTYFRQGPNFKSGISKIASLQWIDPANGLPIKEKSDNGNGKITLKEYTSLQIGPQDPALFQIPAGYEECISLDELLAKTEGTNPAQTSVQDKVGSTAERALDRILNDWLSRI